MPSFRATMAKHRSDPDESASPTVGPAPRNPRNQRKGVHPLRSYPDVCHSLTRNRIKFTKKNVYWFHWDFAEIRILRG